MRCALVAIAVWLLIPVAAGSAAEPGAHANRSGPASSGTGAAVTTVPRPEAPKYTHGYLLSNNTEIIIDADKESGGFSYIDPDSSVTRIPLIVRDSLVLRNEGRTIGAGGVLRLYKGNQYIVTRAGTISRHWPQKRPARLIVVFEPPDGPESEILSMTVQVSDDLGDPFEPSLRWKTLVTACTRPNGDANAVRVTGSTTFKLSLLASWPRRIHW